MNTLNIVDNVFLHSELGYCSDFQQSDIFVWNRQNIDHFSDCPIVYTDNSYHLARDNEMSYAWLIEPIEINGSIYENILNIKDNFKKIFTHEKTLLELGPPFEFIPFGGCWIKPEDQKIYSKSKNISIIASNKNYTTGHKFRQNVIKIFSDKIDVYGLGHNFINYKLDGLKDYKFSIVIENCKRDYWFTEKLIDCFMTGTIPIYWGCPSIGDFFDLNGMMLFDNINDLQKIISSIDETLYLDKFEFISKNFDLAKKYILPDDHLYYKVKN